MVEEEGGKQETCFEILIRGSGRGLVHRDEKKRGEPLKRGNIPCTGEAGAAQTAMLVENNWSRCYVFLLSTLPHTAYWCNMYLERSLSPALTQMR